MSKELDDVSNKNIKWLLIRDFLIKKEKIALDSNEIEIEWFNCNNNAEEWKIDHLP